VDFENKLKMELSLTGRILRMIMFEGVPMMQRTELERILKKAGWVLSPGGKHQKGKHPDKPGTVLTVPNGSKINDITAKEILKDAGLK
jgi:predicted RNA binding protein YcfA (HicA-like mRNA interferase family)